MESARYALSNVLTAYVNHLINTLLVSSNVGFKKNSSTIYYGQLFIDTFSLVSFILL